MRKGGMTFAMDSVYIVISNRNCSVDKKLFIEKEYA